MSHCPSCSAVIDDKSLVCRACGAALDLVSSPTASLPTPATTPRGSLPRSESRFVPGTLLGGRYRLVGLLGRGGMGEVYRADDVKLGQTVALKFLPEAVGKDSARLEAFYAEVRLGRQVTHPNVCRLHDLVEVDGHHCLSMEYVDGEDLSSLLKRIGRLPPDKALEVGRDLCAGLAAAHDKGVLHRDLKPANVMIDGRGRARISDFGLASLADAPADGVIAGTPAYMSPEQLDGRPASVRSDLYALGLVLFETFTGKRLFDASTLQDLRALHAHAQPPSLSSIRDVPPAVERAIQACLQESPAARPESVRAVLAAFPGGDPLQAALAAGETPSPAMVAAAAKVGDLSARQAWAFLLPTLAGLLLLTQLTRKTTLIGRVHPDQPPEVLTQKARELLASVGYRDPPVDSVSTFTWDIAHVGYIAKTDPSPRRWEGLATIRPGPLLFVYRQSPSVLAALFMPDVGQLEVGRVDRIDPPADVAGMAEVVLDSRGGLTSLRVVPPQLAGAPQAADVDWPGLLAATGVDRHTLQSVVPRWTPPFAFDQRLAWDVPSANSSLPLHIEAASYQGRPVWLEVQGPWIVPASTTPDVAGWLITWIFVGFGGLVGGVMVTLWLRNARLGRGDTRGAARLAGFVLVFLVVGMLCRADHLDSVSEETRLVFNILAQAFFFVAVLRIYYLAVEPIARRRGPELLISWTRLLDGRVSDPLVGRDILIGGLVGVTFALIAHASVLAPTWFGLPPGAPRARIVSTLAGSHHLVFFAAYDLAGAISIAVTSLFAVFFFESVLRSRWLARALLVLINLAMFASPTVMGVTSLWSLPTALVALIWVALLLRSGLLASSTALSVLMLLEATPLALDPSAFYAGRALFTLATLTALLLWAFHVALNGKPPFGRSLLEGET